MKMKKKKKILCCPKGKMRTKNKRKYGCVMYKRAYLYNKKLMNSCHEYNMFATFHFFPWVFSFIMLSMGLSLCSVEVRAFVLCAKVSLSLSFVSLSLLNLFFLKTLNGQIKTVYVFLFLFNVYFAPLTDFKCIDFFKFIRHIAIL